MPNNQSIPAMPSRMKISTTAIIARSHKPDDGVDPFRSGLNSRHRASIALKTTRQSASFRERPIDRHSGYSR
jgi:hypothetical protein